MKNNIFKLIAIFIVLYTFIGFFLIPYYIQSTFSKHIQKNLFIESYIDSFYFNPFSFECRVDNLIIKDQNKKNLLYFEKFYFDVNLLSFFDNTFHIENIIVHNLNVNIDLDQNQITNFQFILDTIKRDSSTNNIDETENSSRLFNVIKIDNIDLKYLNFIYNDFSKKEFFKFETYPFDISLENIVIGSDQENKINIDINTKETGNISIDAIVSENPFSISGSVKLSHLNTNKIYKYLQNSDIKFDLESSWIDIGFDYNFNFLKNDMKVFLSDIYLDIPKVNVVQNPYGITLIDTRNKIDNIQLDISDTVSYSLSNFRSQTKSLILLDKSIEQKFNYNNLNLLVNNLTSLKEDSIDYDLSVNFKNKGELSINGSFIQNPLEVNADISLLNLSMNQYEPYAQNFIDIEFDGLLDSKTNFKLYQVNNNSTIVINSDTSLNNLGVSDRKQNKLIEVSKIAFNNASYSGNNLLINNIDIRDPKLYFNLLSDKSTNFSHLIKETSSNLQTKESENSSKEKIEFFINQVNIGNGEFMFEDDSISPFFKAKKEKINLILENLSSSTVNKSLVDYSSIIEQYSLIDLKGEFILVDPLQSMSLNLNLKNLDLPSLSAYSGKYIGYKIKKGKLYLDINNKTNNEILDISNNIKIKDIELGEKVESKDAIDAPIGLAIALLKDSNGVIDLDIPIKGNLSDPEFDISDVISDVIVNTIVGIVSAPFKFLALLTGLSGDEDISNIEFSYGDSEIVVTQKEKLDKITEALSKRPQLKLVIRPAYQYENDYRILQEMKFKEKHPFIYDKSKKFDELYSYMKNIYMESFSEKKLKDLDDDQNKRYSLMIEMLTKNIVIEKYELEQIALNRVKNIKQYLVSRGINEERVELLNQFDKQRIDEKLNQVIVSFELKAQ